MKKVLIFLVLIIGIATSSNEVRSQSFIDYPWGSADYQAVSPGTKVARDTLIITNELTYINYGTRDTNLVLNLDIDEGVRLGALLIIKSKSNTTARDMTFGDGIDGPTLSGTISKTKTALFFYNGTTFLALSVGTQLD